MARYFKIIEINEDTFAKQTGEELGCCQLSVPVGKAVYIAVDEWEEYDIEVPLDMFERR